MPNPSYEGLSARSAWAANQPISELMHKALSRPELVSLAAGFVDQTSLPTRVLREAARDLFEHEAEAQVALQYGPTPGDPGLRQQLLVRLLAQDAADPLAPAPRATPTLDQVVLTAGSNQLLYTLAEALLDPGDIVLCDAPTYFVFTGIVRAMGARAVGVKADARGMCLDALEAQLESHLQRGELERVKAIYVMSYFDNPRGTSLVRERRAQLLALAERYGRKQRIYVIEDAAYRDLHYAGEDVASLFAHDRAGDHVVYAGTFSKSLSPGLRVGYGVLPAPLAAAVLSLKSSFDFGSPHLNQQLVSRVLRSGAFDAHVAELRALYVRKRDRMLAALDEQLGRPGLCRYERPQGGMYVWVEALTGVDTGANGPLFERALEEGVLYVPGEYCFPDASADGRAFMRLSFGGQSEERIELGIQRLARAFGRASRSAL